MGKGKVLLMLDDCWVEFELEEVGIPARSDGLKLVLTTQEIDVCLKMSFQEKIIIDRLSDGLKVSYDCLTKQEKECLLRCALYPKDWKILRADLIELYIDEGLIHGMNMEKMYNEGNQLLDGLANACLLELQYDASMERRMVRMHDLIRDMALHTLAESTGETLCYMEKAGMHLEEMPDDRYQTKELQKISLMKNNVAEIPWVDHLAVLNFPCCCLTKIVSCPRSGIFLPAAMWLEGSQSKSHCN